MYLIYDKEKWRVIWILNAFFFFLGIIVALKLKHGHLLNWGYDGMVGPLKTRLWSSVLLTRESSGHRPAVTPRCPVAEVASGESSLLACGLSNAAAVIRSNERLFLGQLTTSPLRVTDKSEVHLHSCMQPIGWDRWWKIDKIMCEREMVHRYIWAVRLVYIRLCELWIKVLVWTHP